MNVFGRFTPEEQPAMCSHAQWMLHPEAAEEGDLNEILTEVKKEMFAVGLQLWTQSKGSISIDRTDVGQ